MKNYLADFDNPEMKWNVWHSPFGPICLGLKNARLSRLFFMPEGKEPRKNDATAAFLPYINWLEAYFDKRKPSAKDLDLCLEGTDFQLRVWNALKNVPYGSTCSYSELWSEICGFRSVSHARATGNSVARNPVWIILPCHRIIHADGTPGGYAGGLNIKKKLLRHEGATTANFG